MRKMKYTMLAACLLACAPMCGAQVLAKWPANDLSMKNPTNVAASLSAGLLTRANGISSLNFTTAGVTATGWPTGTRKGSVDYYEICLSPDAGATINVTELHFSEKRSADGIRAFEVYWSGDGFVTANRLDSIAVPDDINTRSHSLTGLNLGVCNGSPICFRLYAYGVESETGSWQIAANTLEVRGNVLSTCSPPVTSGGLNFANVTGNSFQLNFSAGSGDSRLVAVRAAAPVNTAPCNGENYSASAVFGQGTSLGNDTYVVYEGSGTTVNLSGLEDGQTYYISVFERNASGFCYKQTAPVTGIQPTLCQSPVEVRELIISSGDGIMSLLWSNPACYDEVLVVASAQPIAQAPSGNGAAYIANAQFGLGSGFSPTVFPVFKGIGSQVVVTGLTNYTNYYFKLFTRKGTDWTSGMPLTAAPHEGCAELGGNDAVFINELHYNNMGEDQDEGVEVFGPAGLSLDAYELHFYQFSAPGKCVFYMSFPISGTIPDQDNGYGTLWFPAPDMVDNAGAIALYNRASNTVVQFFGYRQTLQAQDGIAMGMTSVQMMDEFGGNPSEFETFPAGTSMQAIGLGNCPSDFIWQPQVEQSRGEVNNTQSPLPIELIEFTATLIGDRVLLKWRTASEINNDFMAVERSTAPQSGRPFIEIGRVAGAGTVLELRNYSLWDESPEQGTNYYRLRQVDFDGKESFSNLVVIQIAQVSNGKLQIAPNPSSDLLYVQWPERASESALLQILDTNGRLVQSTELAVNATAISLNISNLAPGSYVLRHQDGRDITHSRFVKQ